jgi:hypothetical protein
VVVPGAGETKEYLPKGKHITVQKRIGSGRPATEGYPELRHSQIKGEKYLARYLVKRSRSIPI